jgi:hypothetical protein
MNNNFIYFNKSYFNLIEQVEGRCLLNRAKDGGIYQTKK